MKSYNPILCLGIFLAAVSVLSAQEVIPNVQLAVSNPDYPVTVGDIYTLAYAVNGTMVTYKFMVDSSYTVRISNLGTINVAGKTYRQLKRDAETIVSNNHPFSGVQLVLTQPGIFRVFVTGEVTSAAEITTWSMERLSSLTRLTTPFASVRNVTVKSADGWVRNYDIFKAERNGDLSQNPYLRPDDVITFARLERRVTIRGAVERPGTYQLLANENLRDLIETYACGLTPMADKTRMELLRYMGSTSSFGEKIALKESNIRGNFILQNYDIVSIPDVSEWWPAIS
ncbi:MAG: SLBB domain-containing protein, partial [Spirochaetaceae bacterium]|nr:SLBB domain-containing protein [Spirochaetaceae bacterium]